jgi:hypothetical protein
LGLDALKEDIEKYPMPFKEISREVGCEEKYDM